MQRDSFVFYRSYKTAIRELPDNLRLMLYDAITDYALDQSAPLFGEGGEAATLRALWSLIVPTLDANYQRYLNSLKGGAPKGNNNRRTTKKQPKNNQDSTKVQTNVNDNVDVDVDDNENDNVEEKESKDSKKKDLSSRQDQFKSDVNSKSSIWRQDMLDAFYDYWSEPNKSGTKMRCEMEATWDLNRRLANWDRMNVDRGKPSAKLDAEPQLSLYDQKMMNKKKPQIV